MEAWGGLEVVRGVALWLMIMDYDRRKHRPVFFCGRCEGVEVIFYLVFGVIAVSTSFFLREQALLILVFC